SVHAAGGDHAEGRERDEPATWSLGRGDLLGRRPRRRLLVVAAKLGEVCDHRGFREGRAAARATTVGRWYAKRRAAWAHRAGGVARARAWRARRRGRARVSL